MYPYPPYNPVAISKMQPFNQFTPYQYVPYRTLPYQARTISKAFSSFNYYNFLEGTQKTLTTINQIIPIVNQVSPMLRNVTTLFKVASVINAIPQEGLSSLSTAATMVSNPIKGIENPTLF